DRLLLTVRRAVVVEEAVTGAVVSMELVRLSLLLELRLVRVDLFGGGRLVLVTEEPEVRAGEILGVVDGRHRLVRGKLVLGLDDAAAPAIDHGIEALETAAGENRVPAARAGAEDTDLSAHVGQRAKPGIGAVQITEHPGVGGPSGRAHLGPHVL